MRNRIEQDQTKQAEDNYSCEDSQERLEHLDD